MFLLALIPEFLAGLALVAGSIAGRVLLALGVSAITYTGSTVALNAMRSTVISSFSGMPADMVNLMAFLWIDKALSVLFSGVAAALVVRGVGNTIKKAVLK
jgi:predicted naringenin-chalcone synthase